MRQFEFPYNFDQNLINILYTLDPEGKTINCIYLPPFIKDYQTILRTTEQTDLLNIMTREEYESHIHFINTLYPNKIQILLQKENIFLSEEKIKYYISLGIKNFCVASIEQAKIIKNINKDITIVGSIAMQITKEKIEKNIKDYSLYFNSFVLPFSASRNLDNLKYFPKNFNYILLVNAYCNINCPGKHHWEYDYKNQKEIKCPGLLGDINWEQSARIRPMDLGFFDQYIAIYKLQDRGWPTQEIIRDYVLYTSSYDLYPNIEYDSNIYKKNKKYCYMTFTDKNFIKCVLKQKQQMDYLNIKYPYIVLIDKNDKESANILSHNNIIYQLVDEEKFLGPDKKQIRFQKTFNKFKIIDYLDKYEKICWIDADTLFIENLDYIFDNFDSQTEFKGWIRDFDDNLIEGSIFYITNKLNKKEFKKYLYNKQNTVNTDEEILNSYFKNKSTSDIQLCSKGPFILHFTGAYKIFNFTDQIDILNFIFNKLSVEEFNKFIIKNKASIISFIQNWNKTSNILLNLNKGEWNE